MASLGGFWARLGVHKLSVASIGHAGKSQQGPAGLAIDRHNTAGSRMRVCNLTLDFDLILFECPALPVRGFEAGQFALIPPRSRGVSAAATTCFSTDPAYSRSHAEIPKRVAWAVELPSRVDYFIFSQVQHGLAWIRITF